MSVDVEQDRTYALFLRVDQIGLVADTLATDDPRRLTLNVVVQEELSAADAVRPIIAAGLLQLTEKTIRAWVHEGVLTAQTQRPRLLLEPARLYRVRQVVSELRTAGKNRTLLDEVYRRLADGALLDREDLQESVEQMRRGQGRFDRGAA